MEFDLVIRGGTLLDGTGRQAVRGDLGIRGGKIVALGEARGDAVQVIDADGLAVAPGFIDVHTHYDAQVMWDRMLTISPWHGVTTVVMGNCGFGVAPTRPEHRGLVMRTLEKVEGMSLAALEAGLGERWPFETFPQYLDAVERRGTALNVGVLLGHTPLRLYVMGEEATERAATAEEIARMRALVREAIDAGALGFATSKASTHVGYGGKPVPSRAATVRNTDMPSKRNGALNWNSKFSVRHVTCGTTCTPRRTSSRERSSRSRWEPGPIMPARSAVHVTGRPVARAIASNSGKKRSRPTVACTMPRPASPRAPASAWISPRSAARLGTGLPP